MGDFRSNWIHSNGISCYCDDSGLGLQVFLFSSQHSVTPHSQVTAAANSFIILRPWHVRVLEPVIEWDVSVHASVSFHFDFMALYKSYYYYYYYIVLFVID